MKVTFTKQLVGIGMTLLLGFNGVANANNLITKYLKPGYQDVYKNHGALWWSGTITNTGKSPVTIYTFKRTELCVKKVLNPGDSMTTCYSAQSGIDADPGNAENQQLLFSWGNVFQAGEGCSPHFGIPYDKNCMGATP